MTTRSSTPGDTMDCAAFEERLAGWLEGRLDDTERAVVERHHTECATCAALVSDLDGVVQAAHALPALVPSRDLWSGIESRLAAPVIALPTRGDAVAVPAGQRNASIRWFAVAATVLVAVTSGVTWTVARARFEQPTANVATTDAAFPVTVGTTPAAMPAPAVASGSSNPVSVAVSIPTPAAVEAVETVVSSAGRARVVSNDARLSVQASSMQDVDAIYEREIAALRQIVNRRFATLDTATVHALRRNLETIDQAIADSRRALERDPRSGMLSSELDRTLEAKLALMRRVALL